MNTQSFAEELNARIAKYDLLCHPFYKSWSMGALTNNEISNYACDYYHHVAEFPNYLETLQSRLPGGELRDMILENKADEEGARSTDGRTLPIYGSILPPEWAPRQATLQLMSRLAKSKI